MSDDIPCNNCGVKFSDVEQLRKDAYDSDQDFWRMNELFIKTQTQLKEAEHLLNRYEKETMNEIKFPEFDNVRCLLFRDLGAYKTKYTK